MVKPRGTTCSAERMTSLFPEQNPIFQRQMTAYRFILSLIEDREILDLGCGHGEGSSLLAQRARQVRAVDHSARAIEVARGLFQRGNLSFEVMKVPPIAIPSAQQYDVVVAFQVLEHLPEPLFFLQEVRRVLKAEGTLFLSTPNKGETLTPNPYHLREYGPEELKALLGQFFSEVRLYGVFGSQRFMTYWEKNRQWAHGFLDTYDPWRLSTRLPLRLRRLLFDRASGLMRKRLQRANPELCALITHEDFIFRADEFEGCLDLFIIAQGLP